MQHLLIVEDEPDILESLEDYFRGQECLVTSAATLAEAEAALTREAFTLILLDLLLPDGDGLDLLAKLRRSGNHTPLIVLTALGAELQRVRGLKLGADDYLVKPFSLHELSARMEAVLRRSRDLPCQVRIGSALVDLSAHEVSRAGATEHLLAKEVDLLAWLLRHPGRTFRRAELLREVWGFQSSPSTRTVDTHICALRRKIESEPEHPRHLLTVHGVGYRLVL